MMASFSFVPAFLRSGDRFDVSVPARGPEAAV